jgi:histidinol dehydrogenase
MIRIVDNKQVGKILSRRAAKLDQAEKAVRPILDAVRKRGDAALRDYTRKLDGSDRREVRVSEEELEAAWKRLSAEFRSAVKKATENIRDFARLQVPREGSVVASPGRRLSQIVRPLDVVAAYIPSGRYPLPSTLMMTLIPAKAAGVKRIAACSPRPADAVWGTAAALRVNDFYQMGGAHAIAAFAYGTKTVPKADRIVGPGNIYVAAAKKMLSGDVGIDFVAGPTEVLIIAAAGEPRWLAADMLAQAEHDVDASAVLLTTSRRLAEAVAAEIERQLDALPTAAVARKSIKSNSAIIVVRSLEEALEISNQFAPEHLSIPNGSLLDGVRHAGSVFIGAYSPEAAGDYASGPNHVLPTSGVARQRGGLSAADFVKIISVQELSVNALRDLAPAVTTLARAEGLEAHARSVEVRFG